MGIYSLNQQTDPLKLIFLRYTQPYEETNGYFGYLSDSVKVRTYLPPVSLSENTMDFGRVLPVEAYNRMCTVSNCLTMVTSLTNHIDAEIEIIWEKGCGNFRKTILVYIAAFKMSITFFKFHQPG